MKPYLYHSSAAPGPDGQVLALSSREAGWRYLEFQAFRLQPGQVLHGLTGRREECVVLLGGRADLSAGTREYPGTGDRSDVWEQRPPYALLVPPNLTYSVRALTACHLAVCGSPAPAGGKAQLITPEAMVREERGEGQTRRVIRHILPPAAQAKRLILVEVYTPAGNWSSFPPHKHDTEDPPHEAYLEEVCYYQIRPSKGFALQRLYTDDRSLDLALAPGDGDLVRVPRGYHPVAATPGHDCYCLNVMAGPGRAWNFRVDPDYADLMSWHNPS